MTSRSFRIRTILIGLFLILNISASFAQKFTISGYVTEEGSGEPIIGAAVFSKGTTLGTTTSTTGYYSISLDSGDITLEFSCLGYKTVNREVHLNANQRLNISLGEDQDMLSEAVIVDYVSRTGMKTTQMSAIEVPINQIKAIPAIAGEVDVIKALQLLPGVQSGTEAAAGIYVRGGGADENLLLMDGVPLYNVNHLFGFFSVFNADALKNVTMYKGNFPARFGGHLSSVIDVRMNDGNENELHGSLSVGLISSKFNLEGPLVKGRTTFNISARRTYLDLLARPALAFMNHEENKDNHEGNLEKYMGGYNFYDLNVKITHRLKNNDRISLAVYSGDDKAFFNMVDENTYTSGIWDPETNIITPDDYQTINKEKVDLSWKWGNLVNSLRWSHEISPKLYLHSSANYTQYRSTLGLSVYEYGAKQKNGTQYDKSESTMGVTYNSVINDISANADFEWHPDTRHDAKFGLAVTSHNFRPGIISMKSKTVDDDPDYNEDYSIKTGDKPLFSKEAAAYFEDNWSITPWFKADLGIRTSLYSVSGKTYLSAEPRLSARALVNNQFSIKASYAEMSQYIHLLSNSNISLPSDLWVPVTKNIKPMRSHQSALGLFYDKNKWEFSAEGYYKSMDNVLEYKDGASYFGSSTGWEQKVNMGKGWSYGLELLAQKKVGKTTGWVGYTWSKSMRQFDRPGMEINGGDPFPAKYDRRHDFKATVSHTFSKKFDLSATFVYTSGNCGTLGFEDYETREPATDQNNGSTSLYDGYSHMVSYVPNRNNYRMPAYNRMDIGMNFYKQKKHGTRIWNISVYNLYNRLNPFMVMKDYDGYTDPETGKWETRPVLKKYSIFPILPSVSYTFKF